MKLIKKIILGGMAAALLASQVVLPGGAAAPKTKLFLETYSDTSFPLAKQVNMEYPKNYDAKPTKSQVFGMQKDPPAYAAVKIPRTLDIFKEAGVDFASVKKSQSMMKNYVGVKLETIYEFKNGFKDFEFMGACGVPNIWVGAFGKKGTIEFSYADKISGPWTALDYMSIREIESAASQKAYFTTLDNDKVKIPTSARYLKVTFPHGRDASAFKDEAEMPTVDENGYPVFWNWEMVLGYLAVWEYETPQNTGTAATSSQNNKPDTSSRTTAVSSKDNNAGTASQNETASNHQMSSAANTESANSGTEINSTEENQSQMSQSTTESNGKKTQTVTRINWPAVIGAIVAGVIVIGGGAAVLIIFLLKRKKAQRDTNESK